MYNLTSFKIVLEIFASETRQDKELKGTHIGMEELKLPLFTVIMKYFYTPIRMAKL